MEVRVTTREIRQYRQGDVLLLECESFEELRGSARERPVDGRLVLALGEATGHAHTVRASGHVALRARPGTRWLQATAPVQLEHQEHGPITVGPGTYAIVIQREYVPPRDEARTLVGAVSARRVRD